MIFRFWVCIVLALLNMASLGFLMSQGQWSWPGIGIVGFWLLLATLFGYLAGPKK